MRFAFVDIEGGPSFPCLVTDEGWNGFAVPYFTREIAVAVAREYASAYNPSWAGEYLVMWDTADEDDRQRVLVDTMTVDDEMLYGIGAGSWIWTESEGK